MKTYIVDISAWTIVGVAAGLGAYACYLFDSRLAEPLAERIVDWLT